MFVGDVKGRLNAYLDDSSHKPTGCVAPDRTLKDQLHTVRAARCQIAAHDLLKKLASLHGTLERVGETDSHLPEWRDDADTRLDNRLPSVATASTRNPLVEEGLHLFRSQLLTEFRQSFGLTAIQEAIVQGCEIDARMAQLLLTHSWPLRQTLTGSGAYR